MTHVLLAASGPSAQSPTDRARARDYNRLGWDLMRGEKFEEKAISQKANKLGRR